MTDIQIWEAHTLGERAQAFLLRHRLFCLGECGEALEHCAAVQPNGPHDEWDGAGTHLLVGTVDGALKIGCRLPPGPHLPSLAIVAKRGGRVPDSPSRYNEPSRVGLSEELQATAVGAELTKGLLGSIVTTSVASGFHLGFLTIRPRLLKVLMRLMPIEFDEPFEYGKEDGGPDTSQPIPTWSVFANYHEIGAAVERFLPPATGRRMFPDGFNWIDPARVRPEAELAQLMAENPRKYAAHMTQWRVRYPDYRG